MQARWRIDMLGGLRLTGEDREITRFQTYKTGALLAYLALHRDRIHPREVLIALLWPDSTLDQGRPSLSVALSSLRHLLEPPGVLSGTALIADRTAVRLNPAVCMTDVILFEEALQAARRAESETDQTLILRDAVDGYRGELLPGYYEDWCVTERQRLLGIYCQTLRDLVRRLVRSGDLIGALDHAQRAVNADSLNEELHSDLIRLYVAAGQPSSALRQYRELTGLLEAELHMRPSSALQGFVQEIERRLAQPPAQTKAIPADPAPARPPTAHPGLSAGTITFLLVNMSPQKSDLKSSDLKSDVKHTGAADTAIGVSADDLRRIFARHDGWTVRDREAGFVVLFSRASDALNCAVSVQRTLATCRGSGGAVEVTARVALHTAEVGTVGKPLRTTKDLRGPALKHAERLLMAAHGGQTLCTGETAAILRRCIEPPLRLTDLGLFRLQAEEAPERLFEVCYPDRPQLEFPAPKATASLTANLPLQFTRFFGRTQELEKLLALLQQDARLITLTGPGGTGKTRLAIEAASQSLAGFRDAVWFVSLEALRTPDQIADAILAALRQPSSPGQGPIEQVIEALAGRLTLLVLDNFEHLLTDAGAEESQAPALIRTLLERLPLLKCLITSQRRLHLSGEIEFNVPPLPLPSKPESKLESRPDRADESASLSSRADSPAFQLSCPSVALFADRAQAVRPDFQVTSANVAAIAALCKRLEGIPLAIELAAARSQVLTPTQMLNRLESRFEFLISRRNDVPPRHKTLRATIEWSYQLLAPELQRFLAQLSVFQDGWQLEAAEVICAEPLALDYLAQLQECSLIVSANIVSSNITEGTDVMRFRMLETLREYGQERLLESGTVETIRKRHHEWFLKLALTTEPAGKPAEQATWLQQLEHDYANLLAALHSLLEDDAVESGARLCIAMAKNVWERCGRLREGRTTMQRCIERRAEIHDPNVSTRLTGAAGWLCYLGADYEQAREWQQQSLAAYQEMGNDRGQAVALNNLAVSAQDQGDLVQAQEWFRQSLEIARRLGEQEMIASRLSNLGQLEIEAGQITEGQTRLQEAYTIFRALRDQQGIAGCLCNLTDLALRGQDWDEAQDLSERCLDLFQRLEDRRGVALARANLAEVAARQGRFEAAESQVREALAICAETGIHWLVPVLLETRARALLIRGAAQSGMVALAAAERLRELLGAPRSKNEQADCDVIAEQLETHLDRRASSKIRTEFEALSMEETVARASK